MKIQGTKIRGLKLYSSAATVDADSYFNLVTLLLPGTGTNGAQNNTFLDSSASPLTVTRNGSVTQGAFSPFTFGSGTQADGYFSGYFDGTGDYLSVASNAALGVGSGDFTVECWIYLTQNFDATGQGVVTASYNTNFAAIGTNSGAGNRIDFYVANVILTTGTNYISLNTWTHLAFVRLAGTTRIYFNGVQVASSGSLTGTGAAAALYVGTLSHDLNQEMTGYISNVRLVKGTAVYTSAFTPSTTPLTAIANTSLLTCQSSRFTDNSTNAFAITVNGNSQPSLINPFNVTNQPLQAWSNYFDGTGDYLSTADNASLDLGTSDFCIEGWFFLESTTEETIVAKWGAASTANSYLIFVQSGVLYFFTSTNGLNSDVSLTSPVTTNEWYHVAAVRSGSSYALFLNGARVATVTNSNTIYDSASGITIGRYTGGSLGQLNGYVSNIRIVKGTAVYSPAQSTITVPTSPLSAVANTVLLTCQSNRFIDNSTNAFAITRYGDTSVQAFSPFEPTEPYSTTSVGGSVYFDGSNSKLTTSANIDISGLFTIECWYNLTVNNGWFFTIGNLPVFVDVDTGQITLDKSSVGVQLTTTANEQAKGKNCWKHLAITRDSGGVIRVFVNGILVGSVTTSYSAGILNGLGAYANYGGNIAGYISNFRVIAGSALYTSNFVPPTAPLTAVSGTAILLSGINAGIYDAAAKNVLETVGGASISTAQSKWGGSAMAFDGSGDWLINPPSAQNQLGTGDFTVEFWFYSTSSADVGIFNISATSSSGSAGMAITKNTSNQITFWVNGNGGNTVTTTTYSINAWHHVALVRNGSTNTLYVDGVSAASNSNTPTWASTPCIGVGRPYNDNTIGAYIGYINDLRITKGLARYTANFTPPTTAFPTQ